MKVLFIELKEFGSCIGDRELIISTYPMNQTLRGASRLLFANGCFWWDDIAEVKNILFGRCNCYFKLVCSLLPDAFLLCFLKIGISKLNQNRVSNQNMAPITQHAIVEEKSGWRYGVSFLFSLSRVLAWT